MASSYYRLQFHRDFGFRAALGILPYIAELRVDGIYCSPLLRARPGSRHGYDICNHDEINPEIGSEAEFEAFCRSAKQLGLALMLDIVPNHMAADPDANLWWRDVLENGPNSMYGHYFDIDWSPLKRELRGKLLLPVLGDHYGAVLERGELTLRWAGTCFVVAYGESTFPVNFSSLCSLLSTESEHLNLADESVAEVRELLSIVTGCKRLPSGEAMQPEQIAEWRRETVVLRERLARLLESEAAAKHVAAATDRFNGRVGEAASFDAMHELLEAQHYRLASWKTASHEINYRRFFEVNELAGVRVEAEDVFDATHRRVGELLKSGTLGALRLDHIDGLFDPRGYLERLHSRLQTTERGASPLPLYAEKILTSSEELNGEWPLAGTTGYDFLNEVNGLFVSEPGLLALTHSYRSRTEQALLQTEIYECKKLIMSTSLAAELRVLADELNRISERDRCSRDFTLEALRDAIAEFVACLPCYRTYCADGPPSSWDVGVISSTLRLAARRNPAMERSIFEFLRSILLNDAPRDDPRKRFVMKLQQYSGPVQAKGVEDTVFYRHNVLSSLNEVGADHRRRVLSPTEFHRCALSRQRRWPRALITTSTHDTKRGEDLRMRINVLSELPEEWVRLVGEWNELHEPLCVVVEGEHAPCAADRELFYQTVVGLWPVSCVTAAQIDDELIERLKRYMQKATREAKVNTSWISPDESYDSAVEQFVQGALRGKTTDRFLESLVPFVERIAAPGFVNGLSQLLLKLTSPGVPDIYQGTELWDFSLVDPDNRRPVSYDHRAGALGTLEVDSPSLLQVVALLKHCSDGRLKLFLMRSVLALREALPRVFLAGEYLPVESAGERADNLLSFVRSDGTDAILVVVPRLVAAQLSPSDPFPIGERFWGTTEIELPPALCGRRAVHVLHGGEFVAGARISVGELLHELPIGLLRFS